MSLRPDGNDVAGRIE